MRAVPALLALALAPGCVHRAAADRLPEPWRFEARAATGVVRVLPVVDLHDEIPVELGSFVGLPVPEPRAALRARRTEQLQQVPAALGERLPGAVNGQLGLAWDGQFRHAPWPVGARERLREALEQPGTKELDAMLAELASRGPEATLFTWVREVDGDPVSRHGFPGDTVNTVAGPVHVSHRDEPYVVTLVAGLALVTRDGEVLIRYEYAYHTVLSGDLTARDAAGDLARRMAVDIVKVWATEAELDRAGTRVAADLW